jgi:AraC-like DNA-binding protein
MRIEYATQLIQQHPDMPVSTIGEQAGFNSSTSFYRNFKLYKGMGPKEYQSSMKDK